MNNKNGFKDLLPERRYVISTNEAAVLYVLRDGEKTTAQIKHAVSQLKHGGRAGIQTAQAIPALQGRGLIVTEQRDVAVHQLTDKGRETINKVIELLQAMKKTP